MLMANVPDIFVIKAAHEEDVGVWLAELNLN